jgi:hypothetical protein
MRRLVDIIILIHTIGGAIAFSAILDSAIPPTQKVLWFVSLMFVSSSAFMLIVAYVDLSQRIQQATPERNDGLPSAPALDDRSYIENHHVRVRKKDDLVILSFSRLGYLLIAMYAIWIIGGLILRRWF